MTILSYYNYYMINFFTQLLDLIYKKKCYFCSSSKENTLMCQKCYEKIPLLSPKMLVSIEGVPVYCAGVYEKELKKLIRGIKYHNQKELAFFQAKLMFDYWQKLQKHFSSDEKFVIVPVPLYKSREKKRKYNQMELAAKEFSKLTGYEVKNDLIRRIKDTKPQYKLTKKEREKNLHNAFECDKSNFHGEKLLLIDDILTTGSTMEEMVKTLKNAGIGAGIEDLTIFVTSCTKYHLV